MLVLFAELVLDVETVELEAFVPVVEAELDEADEDEDEPAVTVTVAGAVEVSSAQMLFVAFSALMSSAAVHASLRQLPARF